MKTAAMTAFKAGRHMRRECDSASRLILKVVSYRALTLG